MIIFLKLKHWQLFCLIFGVSFLLQIITFSSVIVTNGDPKIVKIIFPIATVAFLGLFLSWFYSMGINLNKKLPNTVKMNLSNFKILLIIPIIYIFIISNYQFGNINQQPNPQNLLFILPIHLFSMFCIFYSMYFIAKELKSVELQRPVNFSDFAGEFFLLWFFPVGIWILQPRINKIFV